MSSDTALNIAALADNSDIAGYSWNDRGVAPKGYIRGMAVMFGRVYCKMNANRDAASEMATADSGDDSVDALTWYAPEFSQLGMDNSAPGVNVLRHLFVLLTGLGMRESSGRHCEGRDMDAGNTDADTAEAGLFQGQSQFHGRPFPAGCALRPVQRLDRFPGYLQGRRGLRRRFPGRTGAAARAPISRRSTNPVRPSLDREHAGLRARGRSGAIGGRSSTRPPSSSRNATDLFKSVCTYIDDNAITEV